VPGRSTFGVPLVLGTIWEPSRPVLRPSSRDDPSSTRTQKRWQAASGADICPATARGTSHGGRCCDRRRHPAGDPAQHRCGGRRIAVPLAQHGQCGTVAITEQFITGAQPLAERRTVAVAEHLTVPQPVAVQVTVAVAERVALAQPVALAEQVTMPEPVTLPRSRLLAESFTVPEPVALAQQVTVARSVAP
jgi:hypothetical protein